MKRLAAIAILASLAGCRGGKTDFAPPADDRVEETLFLSRLPPGDSDPEGDFLSTGHLDRGAPLNPAEKAQIDWLFSRLAGELGPEQIVALAFLERFGRRALPEVLVRVDSPHPTTRMCCAYLLGVVGDRAAIPALKRLLGDPEPIVHHEAAASLAALGDLESAKLLIDVLEAEDPSLRLWAISALYRAYEESYGFDFLGEVEARKEAVRRWREWWNQAMAERSGS